MASERTIVLTGLYWRLRMVPVFFLCLAFAFWCFSLHVAVICLAVVVALAVEAFPPAVWKVPKNMQSQARYVYRWWWSLAKSFKPVESYDGSRTYYRPGLQRIRSDGHVLHLILRVPAVPDGSAAYLEKAAAEIQCRLRGKKSWRTCIVKPAERGLDVIPRDATAGDELLPAPSTSSWLVPVGVKPDGSEVTLDLSHPSHMLVSGKTRSGKSSFVYGLLNQMRHLPVTVAGVDPTGILFNELDDGWGGDALRSKRIKNDADAAAVVQTLFKVTEEMERRISLLKSEHRDKWSRNDFQSDPGRRLIIVVLEEYPGLIKRLQNLDSTRGTRPSDRLAPKSAELVERIAYEGAKVGVVLLIVAQRPDAKIIGGPLRAQLSTRVTFAQDPDGLRMVHPGAEQISWASGVGYIESDGMIPLTRFRSYRADLTDLHRPGASSSQIYSIQ
jgi:hypothetical protein